MAIVTNILLILKMIIQIPSFKSLTALTWNLGTLKRIVILEI